MTKQVIDPNTNQEITVSLDTPCHPGKNGKLPVMLDATLDANIFAEMAEKEAKHELEADERALEEVIAVRKAAYGTAEEQIEYAVENGFDALVTRNVAIKIANPKPS